MNMSLGKQSKHTRSELRSREVFFTASSPGVDTEGYSLYWRAGGPCSSLGSVGGFLPCILSISLAAAQRALCHLINQKSWPQVAHRSQSRRRRRKCAPHVSPPQRKSITPSVWTQELRPVRCATRDDAGRGVPISRTLRPGWLGLRRQRGRFSRKSRGTTLHLNECGLFVEAL